MVAAAVTPGRIPHEIDLTGTEKAAILLVALGPDLSAEVLKHLGEEEVETVARAVIRLQKVPETVRSQVLEEFYRAALVGGSLGAGGVDYVNGMLSKAFGRQKAAGLIFKLGSARVARPFDFLNSTDPERLLDFLKAEHPQTVALVLSHLKPNQAAAVLSALDNDSKGDVATRIATMDRTAPDIVEQVESVLKQHLSSSLNKAYAAVGGAAFLAKMLAGVDRGVERTILERLEQSSPDLAAEVRKLIFVFEDIIKLDDKSLQRVLREVDFHDLALALRGCSEDLKEKVFKNLSSRAGEMLKEEMDTTGPVRLKSLDEAQQRIVAVVRRLDEAEEIYIMRGDADVIL